MKTESKETLFLNGNNGSRLCVVPMLKLTQNLIKRTKDGKFRNI